MKFFLIGFMGAGKSTIGKYAARQNNMTFLDLDKYIEEKHGKEIREIFAEDGEPYFREEERKALLEVIDLPGAHLVSCGGGTPCFFDNMDVMNARGTTIYLDLSAARLTDRLRNAKSKRPLVAEVKGDLQIFVHKKLLERAADYGKAQMIVAEQNANRKAVSEMIRGVISEMEAE